MNLSIKKYVEIDVPSYAVWEALTSPALMKKWMSDTPIKVITDWNIGSPFIIQGESYKKGFKNIGLVLQFEKEKILEYSHLSSISGLSDLPQNYTIIKFILNAMEKKTSLNLELSGFPTESILKHIDYYWTITLQVLKKFVEEKQNLS